MATTLADPPTVPVPTAARSWWGALLVGLPGVGLLVVLDVLRAGESVWLDEATSLEFASVSWDTFAQNMGGDELNQGLYYLLLRGWLALVDGTEAIRLLSLLFAAIAVLAVADVGRRLSGSTAHGVVAGVALAANGAVVAYAREIRGYALLLALVCLSVALLCAWVRRPSWLLACGWGVVAALSTYAHFFGLLAAVAQVVALAALPRERRPGGQLLLGGAVLGVLTSPVLLYAATHSGNTGWLTGVSPARLAGALTVLAGGRGGGTAAVERPFDIGLSLVLLALVAAAAGLAAVRLARRREGDDRFADALALSLVVVPVVAALAISLLLVPVFHHRYLVVTAPGVALLVARLLQTRRAWAVATIVGVLTLSVAGTVRCAGGRCEAEAWRTAVADVSAAARPGDGVVLLIPQVYRPWRYAVEESGASAPPVVYPAVRPPSSGKRLVVSSKVAPAEVARAAAGRPRVWLVLSHAEKSGFRTMRPAVDALLRDYRTVSTSERAGVTISLLERRPALP